MWFLNLLRSFLRWTRDAQEPDFDAQREEELLDEEEEDEEDEEAPTW